jgi:hypothetical protein
MKDLEAGYIAKQCKFSLGLLGLGGGGVWAPHNIPPPSRDPARPPNRAGEKGGGEGEGEEGKKDWRR